MPVVKTKSLLAKLGKKVDEAVKKHSKDEVKYAQDFSQIPAGIVGHAHLRECKFDLYKKGANEGEPYFMARAVILDPEFIVRTIGGKQIVEKVRGRQTKIGPIQVCDKKDKDGKVTKTMDEFIGQINQEIRKLGYEGELESGPDMEQAVQALQEASLGDTPIYFKFSTSVRKAMIPGGEEGVWENWNGVDPDYQPEDAASAQQEDNSGGDKDDAKEDEKEEESEDKADEADDTNDEPDLDELAKLAKGKDEEAQMKLSEIALAAGMSQVDIEGVKSWLDLPDMIREAQSGGSESSDELSEDDEDDPYKPDNVFDYMALDAKTKKKKKVECIITAHDKAKKTVDLKSLVDNKTVYKAVKYSELIGG